MSDVTRHFVDIQNVRTRVKRKQFTSKPTRTGAGTNSLESTIQLSGQRSKRSIPDTASYITHSLMKDGVPSENSEVGTNFVFGSKVNSKLLTDSYVDIYSYLLMT